MSEVKLLKNLKIFERQQLRDLSTIGKAKMTGVKKKLKKYDNCLEKN
jgi:hypothetical protein